VQAPLATSKRRFTAEVDVLDAEAVPRWTSADRISPVDLPRGPSSHDAERYRQWPVTATPLSQLFDAQSESAAQIIAVAHGPQVPPQSTSDS
jgi:hypothetical protein